VIHLGLCGFTMNTEEYFRTFRTVEVQQTFYEPPMKRTMERWRAIAPDGFEFTMKAWQLITHRATSRTYRRLRTTLSDEEKAGCGAFRPTAVVMRGWTTTLECARILGARAILFQCPASFKPAPENIENMQRFFRSIERPAGVDLLWEPRGDWPDETVRAICRELDLGHAVDPFVRPSVTPSHTYWRLHGTTGSRHVYSDAELRQLLSWIPDAADCWVLFNNLPRVGDAKRFASMLSPSSDLHRLPLP
jgi:uncharacterized protein YecE (DUF72 family)